MVINELQSGISHIPSPDVKAKEFKRTALVFSILKSDEFKNGIGKSEGELRTKEMLNNMGYNNIRFFGITRGGIYFKFLPKVLDNILEYAENQKLKRPLFVVDDLQEFRDILYAHQFKTFARKFILKDCVEVFCEGSREMN